MPSFSSPPLSTLIYIVGSITALLLLPIPLLVVVRRGAYAWNMGTIALVGWISLACLNGPLNSLIWMDNTEDHDWAPVFCVSSLLFTQAAMVGIPTAALAINRRFYLILRRARQQEISAPMPPSGDILICVLPPVLYLVLQGTSSFQQQRKFDIFESVGCMPAFWNDAATYTLGYVPPILVSVVALGYGLLATRAARSQGQNLDMAFSPYVGLSFWRYAQTSIFANGGLIAFFLPSISLEIAALPQLAAAAAVADGHLAVGVWSGSYTTQFAVEYARWAQGPILAAFAFLFIRIGIQPIRQLANQFAAGCEILCCFSGCRRRRQGFTLPKLSAERKAVDGDSEYELQTTYSAPRIPPMAQDAVNFQRRPPMPSPGCEFRHDGSLEMSPQNDFNGDRQYIFRDPHTGKFPAVRGPWRPTLPPKPGCAFRHNEWTQPRPQNVKYIFRDPQTNMFPDSLKETINVYDQNDPGYSRLSRAYW